MAHPSFHRGIPAKRHGMTRHAQVADGLRFHRDGMGQRAHPRPPCGIGRQEPRCTRLINILKNGKGLGQPKAINLQHRHKALRIGGQMRRAALRTRNQIHVNSPIGQTGKVQPDPNPIGR